MRAVAEALGIGVVRRGRSAVAHVAGDIGLHASPGMRTALSEALEDRWLQRLTLDLRGVKHIDSSGVTILLEAWNSASARWPQLILAGLAESARHLLARTGLDGVFEIAPRMGRGSRLKAQGRQIGGEPK